MLRLFLALMLVSCTAPASVSATPTASRSVGAAPTTAGATTKSAPTPEPTGLAKCAASQLQAIAAGVLGADSFVGAVFIGMFVDRAGKPVAALGTPRCDDASGPSTLTVYPFREPVQ